MAPRKAAIGIDVGGTFAKICAVSGSRVLGEDQLPTQPGKGPGAFVRRVCEFVDAWRRSRAFKVEAVGLGLAGDVDSERGRLRFAPNLRGWEGFDLKSAFSRRLGARVIVENDANVAVWGGYVLKLKRGPRHVVGITLGTGVGGGLILGGRLHRGATGSAGEIGHTRVAIPGERCHCGLTGCLEAYAGSYGIVRTARKLLARDGRRSLLRGETALDPAVISRAAARGDRLAREVWERTGEALAVGLSNLVLILNPEVVLLLGGVSRAAGLLLGPFRRHVALQPFKTPFGRLKVVAAADRHWGCLGAALLAAENGSSRR